MEAVTEFMSTSATAEKGDISRFALLDEHSQREGVG
jgi:hypothetical protein